MMSLHAIKTAFLAAPSFAVVGASKDQSKFGTKVLKWYQARNMDVTPVHPRESDLEGIQTIKTISELSSPDKTAVSIITPPKVTLEILKQAKELNVPVLWLQPGAEDAAVVDYIRENALKDRVIYGGSCILMEGDSFRQSRL